MWYERFDRPMLSNSKRTQAFVHKLVKYDGFSYPYDVNVISMKYYAPVLISFVTKLMDILNSTSI